MGKTKHFQSEGFEFSPKRLLGSDCSTDGNGRWKGAAAMASSIVHRVVVGASAATVVASSSSSSSSSAPAESRHGAGFVSMSCSLLEGRSSSSSSSSRKSSASLSSSHCFSPSKSLFPGACSPSGRQQQQQSRQQSAVCMVLPTG